MNLEEAIQHTQQLSGRWIMPILLHLKSSGGRFTPLQKQLQISPSRLSDNFSRLVSKQIVKRLSPYERRHPLLPEYELTEYGGIIICDYTMPSKSRGDYRSWSITPQILDMATNDFLIPRLHPISSFTKTFR